MRESERVTEKKGDRKSVWVSEKGGGGVNIGTVRHTAPSDKQEPRLMLPHTRRAHTCTLHTLSPTGKTGRHKQSSSTWKGLLVNDIQNQRVNLSAQRPNTEDAAGVTCSQRKENRSVF